MEPLLTVSSPTLLTGTPDNLYIYEDFVELAHIPGPIARSTQRIEHKDIAQVGVSRGWVRWGLVIESRGGGCIVARNLWRADAEQAARLIDELRANRPPEILLA